MPKSQPKARVINGRGHLIGRLASVVAKSLLQGERVVIVGCEQVVMSGKFFRAKLKYLSFLRKRCNVNPARGPFHHRAPREIMLRTVRGMLPHRTRRGELAFHHLKCYEGIPPPYDKMKLQCVPKALRVLGLKPGRKFCHVGRLSHEVGWKYQHIVRALEAKRKCKMYYYKQKMTKLRSLTREAAKKVAPQVQKDLEVIRSYGYNTGKH
ncbi:hypothetical protein ONE63_000443 [Megalurothrips usitatus]|uniref:Large ribosomal subunit protein uL13 n=1 Tax=Megalurothrips usitatus TaxID=439358 RepID=A0AAV7Y594_9NEOP|nr:hypothetical protein ONE63_000443 [Megalurothrips usitatus]